MIVITLTDCPISLRGDLTKWLLEINTGVFVGRVSARVRDNLWQRVEENVKNGRATLVYSTNNEQHMDFRIHHSENEIIDFDGLKLVLKPSRARTKDLTRRRMGFSKAAKMRMAQKTRRRSIQTRENQQAKYPDDYVVVDLETTGLDARKHEIIEIGLLKVRQKQIMDRYQVLIKPERMLSPMIENFTGITNALLGEEGKSLPEVLPDIRAFIGKDVLVGHNVIFDVDFLNQAFQYEKGEPLHNLCCDTMKMYVDIFKSSRGRKKLADIVDELHIDRRPCHRAMEDCCAVQAVYEMLKEKLQKTMHE